MDAKTILTKINNHTPSILGSEQFKKYAILLPLVQQNDGIYVLFEVRSRKLRRQPGDICFPGGKMDEQDKTEMATALRETEEELGISKEHISDIYPIDYLVSPFGMFVYPYVGFIHSAENIKPNPAEVEDTFMVPLSFFMEEKPQIHQVHLDVQPEDDFPYDLIAGGENYDWRTRHIDEYFYVYEDRAIWGLTAKILSHFVELVSEKDGD